MKSVFTLALAFFSLGAFAQTTLEFNQIILKDTVVSGSTCNNCWTVPAGKAWKITGASAYSTNSTYIRLNGKQLSRLVGEPYTSTNTNQGFADWRSPDFPIWLPAGTTLGYEGSNGTQIAFYGIEFNVVP